jgi:hypothetical protein
MLLIFVISPAVWRRKKLFQPSFVLGDFDPALRSAVGWVWNVPGTGKATRYLGDYFHFLKNNLQNFYSETEQGAIHRKTLTTMLQILFHSSSTNWAYNLKTFISFWMRRHPVYASYFTKTWVDLNPPNEWLQTGRPPSVPSGDQLLEAFNNRLKKTGLFL